MRSCEPGAFRWTFICPDSPRRDARTVARRALAERHYALNWLIGYRNQARDDVTTDT